MATQDNNPMQTSVIPYRMGDDGVELCLITTRRAARWGFPKGWVEEGQDPHEAALAEAWEEAGLTGWVDDQPLGHYSYKKRGQRLSVQVMLMEVGEAHDQWQEAAERERMWATPEEAAKLIDRPTLRRLMLKAVRRLNQSADNPRNS